MGLGKTIQAGLLLRQAWLSGRAKRILVLAPKAVLGQWQIELREKFNLNWPIYDGRLLVRYPSPALRGRHRVEAGRHRWHEEPAVIASSHLMRRRDRAAVLLEDAAPWDLVVLDEAHHARRRAAGAPQEGGPNALLRLMRGLEGRTQGLVLLTATPMQVHPVEVWDLLDLLGLPPEWSAEAFLRFFEDLAQPSPSSQALDRMSGLFRAVERSYGEVATEDAQRLTALSRFKANKVLRALRDPASIPRRQLPRTIADAVVSGAGREGPERTRVTDAIEGQARQAEAGGFDLDTVLDGDVTLPDRPASPVTMGDLDRVIGSPHLMPPGTEVRPLAPREYGLLAPGMSERLRVTTDPAWYEEHAESVELWSPGNPLFTAPEFATTWEDPSEHKTLSTILGKGRGA